MNKYDKNKNNYLSTNDIQYVNRGIKINFSRRFFYLGSTLNESFDHVFRTECQNTEGFMVEDVTYSLNVS